jgi:hypothetical protein
MPFGLFSEHIGDALRTGVDQHYARSVCGRMASRFGISACRLLAEHPERLEVRALGASARRDEAAN